MLGTLEIPINSRAKIRHGHGSNGSCRLEDAFIPKGCACGLVVHRHLLSEANASHSPTRSKAQHGSAHQQNWLHQWWHSFAVECLKNSQGKCGQSFSGEAVSEFHPCMHRCVYIYIYMHMYVYLYVVCHRCIPVYTRNIHIYIYIYMYTYVYIYIYVCMVITVAVIYHQTLSNRWTANLRSSDGYTTIFLTRG